MVVVKYGDGVARCRIVFWSRLKCFPSNECDGTNCAAQAVSVVLQCVSVGLLLNCGGGLPSNGRYLTCLLTFDASLHSRLFSFWV